MASEARFWQGTIHQALRDSTAAVAQFEQVVAGEAAPELACRALLEVARLRHEQSDALYEQILTQCTDEEVRGLAALVLGRRYRQAGRGDQARRVLESIVSTQPQYMYAQLELAQLHVEAGKADAAIELIAQQLAQMPECRAYCAVGAVTSEARRARAGPCRCCARPCRSWKGLRRRRRRWGWAGACTRPGQYEAAWKEWEAAWQAGALAGDQQRSLLQAMSACAQTLEDSGRMERVYRAMVENEATRVEGLLGLGQWYLDQGEAAQAAAQVRPLLAHEERAWLLLGRALVAQDSLAGARAVLEEGLGRTSGPAQAAEFHFESGQRGLGRARVRGGGAGIQRRLGEGPAPGATGGGPVLQGAQPAGAGRTDGRAGGL